MPVLEYSPEKHRVKGSLFYQDPLPSGRPSVLLLHGLGANSASWQLQTPALLGANLRPLAVDVPGFGQSRTTGRWSIRNMAGSCAALLEALATGPADIVGISMGGTIALQLALDFPHLARKLVLVNTFSKLRPRRPADWLYFARRFLLVHTMGIETQARFVSGRIFPNPDQVILRQELITQILSADPGSYRAAMRSLGLFDVKDRLSEIRVPVLVVTGEKDTTVPLPIQGQLAAGISGARQVFIPGAGHAVTIDQAEAFNTVLLDFLLK